MSDLVGNPEGRFCRDAAQIINFILLLVSLKIEGLLLKRWEGNVSFLSRLQAILEAITL